MVGEAGVGDGVDVAKDGDTVAGVSVLDCISAGVGDGVVTALGVGVVAGG